MKLLSLILLCGSLWSWNGDSGWCNNKALAVEPKGCSNRLVLTESTATLSIAMIQAQMYVESRGDWGAVSRAGCLGVLQIHPRTAKDYGIPIWTLHHPVLGLDAGIAIMSKLWTRYENVSMDGKRMILRNEVWKLALGSFNCGASRVDNALKLGAEWQLGIPEETRQYIVNVLNRYKEER